METVLWYKREGNFKLADIPEKLRDSDDESTDASMAEGTGGPPENSEELQDELRRLKETNSQQEKELSARADQIAQEQIKAASLSNQLSTVVGERNDALKELNAFQEWINEPLKAIKASLRYVQPKDYTKVVDLFNGWTKATFSQLQGQTPPKRKSSTFSGLLTSVKDSAKGARSSMREANPFTRSSRKSAESHRDTHGTGQETPVTPSKRTGRNSPRTPEMIIDQPPVAPFPSIQQTAQTSKYKDGKSFRSRPIYPQDPDSGDEKRASGYTSLGTSDWAGRSRPNTPIPDIGGVLAGDTGNSKAASRLDILSSLPPKGSGIRRVTSDDHEPIGTTASGKRRDRALEHASGRQRQVGVSIPQDQPARPVSDPANLQAAQQQRLPRSQAQQHLSQANEYTAIIGSNPYASGSGGNGDDVPKIPPTSKAGFGRRFIRAFTPRSREKPKTPGSNVSQPRTPGSGRPESVKSGAGTPRSEGKRKKGDPRAQLSAEEDEEGGLGSGRDRRRKRSKGSQKQQEEDTAMRDDDDDNDHPAYDTDDSDE